MTVHLSCSQPISAPAQAVFDAITDWPAQGQWMLGTRVEIRSGTGAEVGSQLAAWTGLGPAGFWDTMTITAWDAPHVVDVLHTGSVVKGTGTMAVRATSPTTSTFVWSEDLDIPLGVIGALGWPLVRPGFLAGVKASLRRFAALVESGDLPRPTAA